MEKSLEREVRNEKVLCYRGAVIKLRKTQAKNDKPQPGGILFTSQREDAIAGKKLDADEDWEKEDSGLAWRLACMIWDRQPDSLGFRNLQTTIMQCALDGAEI